MCKGASLRAPCLGEEALPIVEIVANRDGFYSYDAKYEPGGSTHIVPAPIDEGLGGSLADARTLGPSSARSARLLAQRFHRYARSAALSLEINSLPGLTPVSLMPDACAAVGISFEALIDRLVGYARARADLRDAVA